jgi:hypothetical protein
MANPSKVTQIRPVKSAEQENLTKPDIAAPIARGVNEPRRTIFPCDQDFVIRTNDNAYRFNISLSAISTCSGAASVMRDG